MHRTISNYKITKRKDGRYYVRLQDGGDITHIYGKTKAEIQAKLEIKLEELNTLSRRRTEQAFPTRNITLANWAHLCLDTFCASSISGTFYATYAGNVLFLLKIVGQCDTIRCIKGVYEKTECEKTLINKGFLRR